MWVDRTNAEHGKHAAEIGTIWFLGDEESR
jgi:hypothetical protein